MLSKEVQELAEKIPQLSPEDKEWLMPQLNLQISEPNINTSNPKKKFNITPAIKGSSYSDTTILDPLDSFIGGVELGNLAQNIKQDL